MCVVGAVARTCWLAGRRRERPPSSTCCFSALRMLLRLAGAYDHALHARPIVVKAATGGLLAFLGDLNAQRLELWRHSREGGDHAEPFEFDRRRSLALTSMSTFWTGPVNHLWYNMLELRWPQASGGHIRSVLTKTALSQFVANPFLYLPTFYLWTGAVLGRTLRETRAKASREYWPVLRACWVVMGTANMLMFSCVPARYQASFMAGAVFCYNTVLSLLSNADRAPARPAQQLATAKTDGAQSQTRDGARRNERTPVRDNQFEEDHVRTD